MNKQFEDAKKVINKELGIFKKPIHNIKIIDEFNKEHFDLNKQNMVDNLSEIALFIYEYQKFDFHDISINFKKILEELLNKVSKLNYSKSSSFYDYYSLVSEIRTSVEEIKTLSIISNLNGTVVIVGANGSGKSSLINFLQKSKLRNFWVLPAHKFMFVSHNNLYGSSFLVDHYRNEMIDNNYYDFTKNIEENHQFSEITKNFTNLINTLVNEHSQIAVNIYENGENPEKESLWKKLVIIWNQLLPDISFEVNVSNKTINVNKFNEIYKLNGLSDGEKSIIFYIGNVLLAPRNSYIIVDEPETYLNASIYNKLWDLLIEVRNDCQFIFASHTMDFITARHNASYVWCKSYEYPNVFSLELINKEKGLPLNVQLELLGSRKPILFCEGTLESLDYRVYSTLFVNEYFVKPVGGHQNVISYTKAYNNISYLNTSAIGIIDRDFHDDKTINSLKLDNIYTSDYNEIEMLLMDENVIFDVLSNSYEEIDVNDKLEKYKKEFLKTITNKQSDIALNHLKKCIENSYNRFIINDFKSSENITNEIQTFNSSIKPEEIFRDKVSELKHAVENEDYDKLLSMCNLKEEISKGLANRHLDSDYENKALRRIQMSNILKSKLKANLFV